MFCQHCGKCIDDGTRFCPFCGNEADSPAEFMEIADYSEESSEQNVFSATDAQPAEEYKDVAADISQPLFAENSETIVNSGNIENDAVKSVAVKKQKCSVKKAGTGVTVVVCALFMVLTFVLTACVSAMWAAREILSGGILSDMALDIDPLPIKVGDLITDVGELDSTLKQIGISEGANGISADDTVGEVIENSFRKYGLTEDNVEQFLEESAMLPYISEIVQSYENYLLTGEDNDVVREKKLKAVILECVDYAKREFGVKFADDMEAQIDKALKENKDIIRSVNPSESLGAGGEYIRYLFILPVLFGVSIITIAAAVLAGVITKRIDAALITLGVPTLLFGGAFLFVGLFPRVVISWTGAPNALFGDGMEEIGSAFTKIGLSEFATGVVLIAGFVLCKVIAKKIAAGAQKDSSSAVQNV